MMATPPTKRHHAPTQPRSRHERTKTTTATTATPRPGQSSRPEKLRADPSGTCTVTQLRTVDASATIGGPYLSTHAETNHGYSPREPSDRR